MEKKTLIFNWKSKKSIDIYFLQLYFLFIIFIYSKQYSFQQISKDSIVSFLIMWLIFSFIYIMEIASVRRFFEKYHILINTFILILAPIVSFVIVEIMVSNYSIEMFKSYSFFNIIWYAVIYFLIFAMIRNIRITIILSNFLIYIASLLNYLVFIFKGNPILPSDLLAWKTGMSVASNYELSVTKGFIIATFIMLLLFVVASKLENAGAKLTIRNRISGLCIYVLFAMSVFAIFFHTNLIKSTISVLDFFAPKYTYCFYGTAFGFVANVDALGVEPPEGYSVEQVESVFNDISEETKTELEQEPETLDTPPNVIVIMSEAFSDINLIDYFKTNIDYLPYTKTLKENTIKGNLYVSVYGGATSDTEYEFLTGNSMAVMPKNCVPYQQFITEPTDSVVATLKTQGYYNIAIHPYKKNGYKRDIVYPLLGFDEFLSMDDFENPELIRNYISDRESYKKIIEQYETKGDKDPLFIFNVTMQNHGGYSGDKLFDEENSVKLTGKLGYSNVEQYLSLVRESDKAFQILVDYFSQQEEPTIILLYGDHQPALYSDFHDSLMKMERADTYEEKYKLPFIMWANYDIKEANVDKISANYLSSYLLEIAGIQGTAYNQYLMNLYKKLPVINGLFYIDNENKCHSIEEQSEYSDLITKYKIIGYNNAFDKKGRLDRFYH